MKTTDQRRDIAEQINATRTKDIDETKLIPENMQDLKTEVLENAKHAMKSTEN